MRFPEESRLTPAGHEPLISCHVYGAVPLVAVKVSAYAVFRLPLGSGFEVVIWKLVTATMWTV